MTNTNKQSGAAKEKIPRIIIRMKALRLEERLWCHKRSAKHDQI